MVDNYEAQSYLHIGKESTSRSNSFLYKQLASPETDMPQ